ncbi:MAG: hypothetical protein ABI433_17310, partial [Burkholderiaceae bacterium]
MPRDPCIHYGEAVLFCGIVSRVDKIQPFHFLFLSGGFCMQVRLNTIVAAAVVMFGASAYAQDMVVKIG